MLLTLVILAALVLVSVWVAYETYEDYSDKVIARLQNEATRINRDLNTDIEHVSYLLESMGRQVNHVGVDNTEATAALLRSFNNDTRKKDVFAWVNDAQEITITSQKGILLKPIDISDRDYAKKSLAAPWEVHIGRPVLGRLTNKWILPISMGLTDYNDKHLGQILASIDVDTLTENIRKEVHDDGINFAIISKTLAPLTEVHDALQDIRNTLNPTELMANIDVAKRPSQVLSRASLFHQKNNYILYETSQQFPYIILISYNHEMSGNQISGLLTPRLLQIFVIAIFLVLLLWLVQMRVIQPVNTLSDHTDEVVHGLPFRPIPVGAPKEIDLLSDKIQSLSHYIRERVRIEEELINKNNHLRRIKDSAHLLNTARMRFLESLANELQKPVSLINEFSESMKEQHFGAMRNENYLRHAVDIHQSSEELKQMVLDIITVAKLEEDNLSMNERLMDVAFCIHRALRTFQEQPQNRHTDVKLRLDDDLPRLPMDEDRFHQILINLLNGAASHMASGSTMVFEVELDKRDDLEHVLVLMLKYNLALDDDITHIQRERQSLAQSMAQRSKQQQQAVRSDGINMALTRMLVSLHQGEMETRVSPNQVVRQYIRFPIQRVKLLQDITSELENIDSEQPDAN